MVVMKLKSNRSPSIMMEMSSFAFAFAFVLDD